MMRYPYWQVIYALCCIDGLSLHINSALAQEQAPVSFTETIQPLLEQHCVTCHNDQVRKGGLSLSSKNSALAGGESGVVLVPGKPLESYLLHQITPDDEAHTEMPKGGNSLSFIERNQIRDWIQAGADWPQDVHLKEVLWWSMTTLARPMSPDAESVHHPVDAFLLQRLKSVGLNYSPTAQRRTLIRRLYFNLIGLPPAPEAVDRFLQNQSESAYEALVEELLDSPHYGERWARHWLDVVHYGDTHGYDKDKPRPNAWPYRDYVIRAFNEDKPYRRFVQEQIAGDVLFPDSSDGIEALGFIAAGPWDFIGHAEVPESKIDGKIARHLDRDDMVQNTINTFMSLTVGCAQCHDHKFDPITQQDYYSLHAVFAGVDRADKSYYQDATLTKKYLALSTEQRELNAKQLALSEAVKQQAGKEFADLDQKIQEVENKGTKLPNAHGFHSQISKQQDAAKWVQFTFAEPVSLSEIELCGCYDDFNKIGAGFGFPVRFKVEVSSSPDFTNPLTIIDQTEMDYMNPGTTPVRFEFPTQSIASLRITATKLAHRTEDYIFALAEVKLLSGSDSEHNVASAATLSALDSIEAPPRWLLKNITDGLYPESLRPAEVAGLKQQRDALFQENVPKELQTELTSTNEKLKEVETQLEAMPSPQMVYAGTVHYGSGSFIGTGHANGSPRPIHLLQRGNVTSPGEEVSPVALACVPDLPNTLKLPEHHTEGDRRAELAKWLTDDRNPLLWRSMANRIWQYHFGTGIVSTPDDFGRMGELPSHPELLDWLACELRETNSIKHLHKLIVTSKAYQQQSVINEETSQSALLIDPDNRLLWRMNRRQLEAESLRDTMLLVAGKLDLKMYGPGFQDFVIEKPEHSPHYQYHLHDPEDVRSHRRSVYRFLVRSKTQPFMTIMDCADPSMRVATRSTSLSPLQALTMLNNGLSLTMSKHFAKRVQQLSNEDEAQIVAACLIAIGREPSGIERTLLVQLTKEHGLENTCRVLFNLNEFLFVD